MSWSNNHVDYLRRLATSIAPPQHPAGLQSRQPISNTPLLPKDLYWFVGLYGTGEFENGGLFLKILNPFDARCVEVFEEEMESVRNVVLLEGEDYIPYRLYPSTPGLMLWGYGEGRKHFFWLTEGEPDNWPVVAMHDLEITTRFDMPMLQFVEQLLCGDLECGFIGGVDTEDGRVDSSDLQFVVEVQPG